MNIFDIIQTDFTNEITDILEENNNFRIEKIISSGQVSPKDFWYDQAENEWVLLLLGKAEIEYQNGITEKLVAGDYLMIPAHKKHRVAYTSKEPKCIWLCVFQKNI